MERVTIITEDDLSRQMPINKRTLCRYRKEGMPHFSARKPSGALYFTYVLEYILPWLDENDRGHQRMKIEKLWTK